MMAVAFILPVIAVILLFLIVWGIQRAMQNRFTRKTHYKLMIVYFAILLAALIVSEVLEQTTSTDLPPTATQNEVDVEESILSGGTIPEDQLITERKHEIDGKLSIKNDQPDYASVFYIERSSGNEKRVIERVYKPELTISGDGNIAKSYDLSQYVEWNLPVWGEHEVVMPAQSKQKLVFSTYQDSNIISQFSTNRSGGYYGGTSMRYRIVHLMIPETINLDIQLDSDDYVEVLHD